MSDKPRDVQVLPIGIDTVLRSRTWTRLRFEIEYALLKVQLQFLFNSSR